MKIKIKTTLIFFLLSFKYPRNVLSDCVLLGRVKTPKVTNEQKNNILIEAYGCVKGNLLHILLNDLICKFETSFGFQRIFVAKILILMTNEKVH